MKTFNQFLDFILEDNKTSLTQDQQNKIREIKRTQGMRAAMKLFRKFKSKKIRNLTPEKQITALKQDQPETPLGPGEILYFDKKENRWKSNLKREVP
jgi:hypothetical protein